MAIFQSRPRHRIARENQSGARIIAAMRISTKVSVEEFRLQLVSQADEHVCEAHVAMRLPPCVCIECDNIVRQRSPLPHAPSPRCPPSGSAWRVSFPREPSRRRRKSRRFGGVTTRRCAMCGMAFEAAKVEELKLHERMAASRDREKARDERAGRELVRGRECLCTARCREGFACNVFRPPSSQGKGGEGGIIRTLSACMCE